MEGGTLDQNREKQNKTKKTAIHKRKGSNSENLAFSEQKSKKTISNLNYLLFQVWKKKLHPEEMPCQNRAANVWS